MTMADQFLPAQTKGPLAEVSSDRQPAIRVLAIDDESSARKLLSLILGPPAFECATARDGEEAIEILRHERFDVIISDLHMPGMSGMELLAQVRRRYPRMAFLVTTGVNDVEVGVQAMRSGADDYLVKPLREDAVLVSLESALHKRKLEQQVENYRQNLEEMIAERTEQLQAAVWQIEQTYEDTLQALGAAVDLRDNETAGHSQRVCRYSIGIALAMGWSEKQSGSLARGAYLHDIGKLGIPDSILLKPGPLTPEERERMRQHVQIGFDLVKDIPFLADAAEIVLTHHERYDGRGYPGGLKGEEIPLGARIFAVADTLDAITSDRPYRLASSFAAARETIRHCSDSQFDPAVVRVFLGIPEETWTTLAINERQTANHSAGFHRITRILRLGLGGS
ncbi:MAG: HD domain-containing phosphohydrolase [Candidatus Acidiferrum sp.]|jgi:cyclic di-GMP phosphodiesterase